jgi:uncharacterized membrane protein YfcA
MDLLITSASALLASCLTFFSGFGLGTILTPVFSLFFPVSVAIAMTAVVHLANNLFKIGLIGRDAHWPTVLRFALPAGLAAVVGAGVLAWASALLPFPVRWLAVGGLLSGLFGGLSGNQGALRSAFLIKLGLSKEAYVGTGAVCTVVVDLVRLAVYGFTLPAALASAQSSQSGVLVLGATVSAFVGSYFGKRVLKRVTLRWVELAVAAMVVAIGTGLACGLL